MAGRGRGRGKFTFDVSKVGFQKGEALPASIQQPPPLFPPLEFKPVPLNKSEADDYLVALKQEFRGMMQDSVYFIKPDVVKKDVERYSDKYRDQKPENSATWQPEPNLNRSRTGPGAGNVSDVTKHLDELAKKTGDDEDEDEEDEVEEGREEQEYDEEEQEEDNDYLVSHYDDGEEVGFQDDDDMDEGPIY